MSGRVVATTLFGLTTALYLAGFVLVPMAGVGFGLNELLLVVLYLFAVVGFLIAVRRPRNAIAWICLSIGFVWGLEATLFGVVGYGLAHPESVFRPELLAAIAAPLWVPGIFVMATFLLMLFPDGRLPSPRWRWLPWLAGSGILLSYVAAVLSEPETHSYGRPTLENPLAGTLASWFDEGGIPAAVAELFLVASLFIAIGASIAALAVRFHRSTGIQRQQLKWLATAGTAVVVLFTVAIFVVDLLGEVVGLVSALLFIVIPISIGIAVLRYRLYEIDRLVSRTVSYAVVVGVLAVVFAGLAIGVPQLLGLPTDSQLFVAAGTLAVAALFNPLRRRVHGSVDRRFNRVRYDAGLEMDRFADRLRTELDLDGIEGEILDLVGSTMQPAAAGVWLRKEPR